MLDRVGREYRIASKRYLVVIAHDQADLDVALLRSPAQRIAAGDDLSDIVPPVNLLRSERTALQAQRHVGHADMRVNQHREERAAHYRSGYEQAKQQTKASPIALLGGRTIA